MGSLNVRAGVRRLEILKHTRQAVSSVVSLSMILSFSFPAGFAFAADEVGPVPPVCTPHEAQTIVSDASTMVGGSAATVITKHDAWAAIDSASWIWTGEESNANHDSASAGEVQTFTRSFTIIGDPVDSSLEIAADNQYDVVLNGVDIASSTADNNYSPSTTITIPAGDLQTGENVIAFTITNGQDPETGNNPAGLAYKLTIDSETCPIAPAFTSSPIETGSTDAAYSYPISTTGTPAATISATTTLPAGLTFTDNGDGTATISGTPTVSGSFPIGLHAENDGGSADQSFVLVITNPCDGWTLEGCQIASVNAQDGWKSTGSYDQGVVANTYGIASFGAKTLRISNAVTSGSFGDQTFVKPSANEAGETGASSNGSPIGTRQNHFVEQFDIASASTSAQSGLVVSVSPDRGDGSRMSYLRFEDHSAADTYTEDTADEAHPAGSNYTDGIHVYFDDVEGTTNPADFVETDIATLDRTVPHTIKFDMTFVDGASNDIVKVYIDGSLAHTGTSWENYYRFDGEAHAEQAPRAVNTLILRAGGAKAPETSGAGFLFDNFSFVADHVDTGSTATNSTTKVHLEDLDAGPVLSALTDGSGKWFMYDDTDDAIDNTLGAFAIGPKTPPAGIGSVGFTATSSTYRGNIATYGYAGTQLAELKTLSFSTYSHSGEGIGANESPFLGFNVDFTGTSTAWQKRLTYVPRVNGSVPQDQWNSFDTIANGTGKWTYSGAAWPTTTTGPDAGSSGIPGTTPRTWNAIIQDYPSARILPSDGWLGVRVGEPGPAGYQADIDKVVVGTDDGTAAKTTTYDFEPTLNSDLALTMTIDHATPSVGDTVTYTLTLTDTGDDTSGTVVHDALPAGLTFVSTSSADTVGVYEATTSDWTIGAVSSTTPVTLHIVATVNSGEEGQTIANTATASDQYSIDANTENDSSTVSLTVKNPAAPAPTGGGGGGGNGPVIGSIGGNGGGGEGGGTPTGNTTPLPANPDSGTGGTGGTGGEGNGAPQNPAPPTDDGGTASPIGTGGGSGPVGPAGSTQVAAAAEALGAGSTTASRTATTSTQLAAIGSLFAHISWLWWILLLLILGGAWWYYWFLGRKH